MRDAPLRQRTPIPGALIGQGSSKPKRRLLVGLGALCLIVFAAWRWVNYLGSPERVALAFCAAIEQGDADRVYALSMREEKSKMGLTPAAVRRTLHDVFYRSGRRVRSVPTGLADLDASPAVNWDVRFVAWTDAATGRPLPTRLESGKFLTMIELFRAENGRWDVSFTRFVSYCVFLNDTRRFLAQGKAGTTNSLLQERGYRRSLLRRWGLTDIYPDPSIIKVDGQNRALLHAAGYRPPPL